MVSTPYTSKPIQLQLGPSTTYEAITREKVESLSEDVAEIRSRVNSIFYLVIGSVLLDVLMRWLP